MLFGVEPVPRVLKRNDGTGLKGDRRASVRDRERQTGGTAVDGRHANLEENCSVHQLRTPPLLPCSGGNTSQSQNAKRHKHMLFKMEQKRDPG
ncbi:hypothetical protein SKAU_G00380740 [Synaphobranchus kaupii]|uniref:Uncharacterized protein n=1 Tax=Synaphobranchus kaupii TaxID=118154 RepID=A0A9Q1IEN5_SYNKA|nr:hypothetical protein SKAU_G00380740 [Synaphobranchus kaupii]